MSAPSHLRRCAALALAALWAALPAAEGLHASAHGHRYCEEHQTIEEARPVPATAAAADEGFATSRKALGDSGPAHAACPLAQRESRKGRVEVPAAASFHFAGAERPSAPRARAAHPQVHLLHVAPKLSPPLS